MYDIVKNPIPKSKLFYTPATEQELLERIQSFPPAERAVAFQIAMMTFNLCNRMVDTEILSKEIFAG
jgi:hypothetical protein